MTHTAPVTEVVETASCTVWMGKDRVIWIKLKPVDHHTLEDAHGLVDAHNRLADGVPAHILCDMRHAKVGADAAARDYYVSPEASRLKIAMAMIVGTRIQRFFGALFLRLNRPPYPMAIFRDPANAIEWLEGVPRPEEG
jgi:hypothetical protein